MAQPKFVPFSNLTLPYLREIDPRVATDLLQIMNTINRTGIPVPLEVAGTDDGGTTIIPLSVDASGHLNINIVSPVDAAGNVVVDPTTRTTFQYAGNAGAASTLHGTFAATYDYSAQGTVGIAIGLWGNFGGACTGPNKLKVNIVAGINGYPGQTTASYICLFNGEVDTGPDTSIIGAYPTYEQFPMIYVNLPAGITGSIPPIIVDWSITLGAGAITPAQIYFVAVGVPYPFTPTTSTTSIIGAINQGTSPWVTSDLADGTPGSAVPTKAIVVAGSDGTLVRDILTDTSGRIILGAPSANIPVTIAAQTLSPIVVGGTVAVSGGTIAVTGLANPLPTTDAADGTPGAAIPAKAIAVAGSDGTLLRDISTDTSGRIILGAPSANLPISIAAQTLSPIIVRDSSDFTPGSAFGASYMGIVGGVDSGGSTRFMGMVAGAGIALGGPNAIVVAAVDAGGLARYLPVDRPGSASNTSSYPISGTDATNSHIILTDTSGRIVLGAPSANLPVTIAAQTLSPIVTKDAADGTLGSAVPASAIFVGGSDGSNLHPLIVTPPGAALPAYAQVVQTGSDGTDSRLLATNASGQLILPPATNSTTINQTLTNASSSTNFGGTAAINAKYVAISGNLGSATVVTATELFIQIETQAGLVLTTLMIYVPLTASIPATGIPFNQVVQLGSGGFTVIANATAILKMVWTWITGPTSVGNAIAYATVGF